MITFIIHAALSPSLEFLNFDAFHNSYRRQAFSLPEYIVYYMAKNSSPSEVYQKMIKSCKYFFIKNPIVIFHCLHFNDGCWRTCVNEECKMLEDKTYRGLNLNIDKFQSKIHVVCNLVTYSPKKQTFITSLIPKLNNDVVDLQIGYQIISLNELLFFQKLRCLHIAKSTVLFDNKTEVPCEIILANFPKIKWYRYFCPQFVSGFSKTVKELLKIPHFSNLEIFEVLGLSESFDIEMYFSYLKNNKKTTSVVTYNGELSEEYKNKLQAITDEILDAELPKKHYLSPLINFNGQFRQTELTELCNKNFLQMTYSWC